MYKPTLPPLFFRLLSEAFEGAKESDSSMRSCGEETTIRMRESCLFPVVVYYAAPTV